MKIWASMDSNCQLYYTDFVTRSYVRFLNSSVSKVRGSRRGYNFQFYLRVGGQCGTWRVLCA